MVESPDNQSPSPAPAENPDASEATQPQSKKDERSGLKPWQGVNDDGEVVDYFGSDFHALAQHTLD